MAIGCGTTNRKLPQHDGPISLGMKQMGARSAGNPHAACDVAGAGNGARTNTRPSQRASPRPYLREAGGEIPPAYSPLREGQGPLDLTVSGGGQPESDDRLPALGKAQRSGGQA